MYTLLVYCMWGIVVASVTAPAFTFETSVGTVVFWFDLFVFVVLYSSEHKAIEAAHEKRN